MADSSREPDRENGSTAASKHYFNNGRLVDRPEAPPVPQLLEQKLGRNKEGELRRLVLFDGMCRLCMGFVSVVVSNDGSDLFRFAPLQSTLGQKVLKHFGYPPDLDSVVLVRDGQAHIKSEAALEVCGELRGPLSALRAFKVLPLGLRDWGYELMAKSRYSLLGHSSTDKLGDDKKALLVDHWEPDPNQLGHICGS